LLENLQPAPRVTSPKPVRPGIQFDGTTGEATTPGYVSEPENFDEFLLDAGLEPDTIEVIPPVRTSRWQQQQNGELIWLTSYRFTFRRKQEALDLLPLARLIKDNQPTAKPVKGTTDSCLVVLWSDLQVGKVDHRGGTPDLIARLKETLDSVLRQIAEEKPEHVIVADLGDMIENFQNAASAQQSYTNDLSIMEQVDLSVSLTWTALASIAAMVPQVTYASVGSNHCQFRAANGKPIGKPTDDWGIFIGRQLARLATESNTTNVRFIEPQPHHESLAIDVFGDGYHVLGIVHGHQAKRPDQMAAWWRGQAFGRQPIADASLLIHGHFHHLRVTECGSVTRGDDVASRFIVMAPTMDNGSGYFRNSSGEDSVPGLATLTLHRGKDYTGTVHKH
jgi:hypothetical protein